MTTAAFPRPLGVPDAPRVDDDLARLAAIDLAQKAEPADENLLNAVQLLRIAAHLPNEKQQGVIDEAATRITMALRAMGERRLTASQPLSHAGAQR